MVIDAREMAAMSKFTEEELSEVIDSLSGSCKSLGQVLEEIGRCDLEYNIEFCDRLDSQIFCCAECNWWQEVCEMDHHVDWVCVDCTNN